MKAELPWNLASSTSGALPQNLQRKHLLAERQGKLPMMRGYTMELTGKPPSVVLGEDATWASEEFTGTAMHCLLGYML